jgi:peptide/nickel transport system permease protein
MKAFRNSFQEILRYPSAVAGIVIIILLVIVAVITLIAIPYQEAISLWRGGEDVWYRNPKTAAPDWTNWFTREKRPPTIVLNSADGTAEKVVEVNNQGFNDIYITYSFDYQYDAFPQDLSIFFDVKYDSKQPFVSIYWITPEGEEIRVGDFGVTRSQTYVITQDTKLQRRVGSEDVKIGLFSDPTDENPVPIKGTYSLTIDAVTFEEGDDVDAEFVLYGLTYGVAGTDHLRRDLLIPLLWGVPIAMAFGLLAAVGTSILTMIIAAVGVWYGGWVDELIQRITEVNLVLPFLSILIMVGTFYSRSIWTILGVTILLSIFTGGIKGFRSIFLQVKQATYIEAALAYGASNGRIIFMYLIPRIIPVLIPGLVTAIPAFVFLEASLALLGLGDPVLPTWGKVINDAQFNGALYRGLYYWILEPAILLMITGLAFAMLGYSLDRVFNPRLRGL